MKTEKETRVKLRMSAKKEFLEKGFRNASLRTICKNAGVTTGALYNFFRDKEELFASLVEPTWNELCQIIGKHFENEMDQSIGTAIPTEISKEEDLRAMKETVHYLYEHSEEIQLLISQSQGSRFEHSIDQMVKLCDGYYRRFSEQICIQNGLQSIDEYLIHWVAHMQVDVFIHLITHEESEQEAMNHVEVVYRYLVAGWMNMFHE